MHSPRLTCKLQWYVPVQDCVRVEAAHVLQIQFSARCAPLPLSTYTRNPDVGAASLAQYQYPDELNPPSTLLRLSSPLTRPASALAWPAALHAVPQLAKISPDYHLVWIERPMRVRGRVRVWVRVRVCGKGDGQGRGRGLASKVYAKVYGQGPEGVVQRSCFLRHANRVVA